MLNKKDFSDMVKEYQRYDLLREQAIQKSREILKLSKQVIYDVHRQDLKNAEEKITQIRRYITALRKHFPETYQIEDISIFSSALQEFTEAVCYFEFISNSKIPTRKQLDVDTENYLMGLSDLTGEVARKAVIAATQKDSKTVGRIRDLVDEIYGQFLNFDFRNSELRKKADQIKWNLKKVEELFFELSMKK